MGKPSIVAQKMTVNLTARSVTARDRAAEREQSTRTDVVNRALQVYNDIGERVAAGKRLAFVGEDGAAEFVTYL